ncbi:MAG: hypothetical protein LBK82_00950 [Planctomycetaceae bacterium]|nr:hypothetical protein [Planctomycetaceae bacterium]
MTPKRLAIQFAVLIWFTVGYRRRDLSAKGCPPDDCLSIFQPWYRLHKQVLGCGESGRVNIEIVYFFTGIIRRPFFFFNKLIEYHLLVSIQLIFRSN